MGKPIIMADIVTRPQNSIGAFSPHLSATPRPRWLTLWLFSALSRCSAPEQAQPVPALRARPPWRGQGHEHCHQRRWLRSRLVRTTSISVHCAVKLTATPCRTTTQGTITSAQSPACSSRPFPPGTAPTSKPSPPTCSAFPLPPCSICLEQLQLTRTSVVPAPQDALCLCPRARWYAMLFAPSRMRPPSHAKERFTS
jgi:hypothetical protein